MTVIIINKVFANCVLDRHKQDPHQLHTVWSSAPGNRMGVDRISRRVCPCLCWPPHYTTLAAKGRPSLRRRGGRRAGHSPPAPGPFTGRHQGCRVHADPIVPALEDHTGLCLGL